MCATTRHWHSTNPGDTKAAHKTYDGLVDYDKKNWEVYYLRGSVLLADGQPDACLKDYDKAVSLNDSDAELYGHISENLQNAGRTQEAQKYLEQGLKLKPSSAPDYENIGKLYVIKGDTENAAQNADTGGRIRVRTEHIWRLANCILQRKRWRMQRCIPEIYGKTSKRCGCAGTAVVHCSRCRGLCGCGNVL